MADVFPLSQQPKAMPPILASVLVHVLVALLLLWRPSLPAFEEKPEPAIAIEIVSEPARPLGSGLAEEAPAGRAGEAPKPIPNLAPSTLADNSRSTNAAVLPAKPTASERDRVLAQVLRHWKPPSELVAFVDAEFKVQVTVLADGTLAAPFSMRSAYDPGAAIDGWNALHPDDPARRGGESFYRALRQAQPLRLTTTLAAKAPFPVILDFRVKDVR